MEWIHCDWSVNPKKRWMVGGRLGKGERNHRIHPSVRPVPDQPIDLFQSSGPLLIGFDVPFGFPLAYADRIGCEDFGDWLRETSRASAWAEFYEPAADPSEINLFRPFYPAKAGKSKHQHLIDGLGVESINDLRRRCDLPTVNRRAASPLFWTMGAQQVGKAAISVWRDWVGPMLQHFGDEIALWPFEGALSTLLKTKRIVVCEAYPAEFYQHLGVDFVRKPGQQWGKRIQADRQAQAGAILQSLESHAIDVASALGEQILKGFEESAVGEDQFDATVGAIGMFRVLVGDQPVGEPTDDRIRKIEGTLLGLTDRPLLPSTKA